MKARIFLSMLVIMFSVTALTTTVCSQDEDLVYEPTAANFSLVGARALAMGGAQIAVANDGTALVYNPAGLARVTRIELSGGLTHQRMDNQSGWVFSPQFDGPLQNNTRFSSANLVLPVPTYRGSLVLALGVNRVKSFDRTMEFSGMGLDFEQGEQGIESETGGIYVWSFGGAVDVSPNVSVGGALNLWNGKDNYTWFYEDPWTYVDSRIVDRYSGFNVKLGVRVQPNKYLVLGGTIDSPVTLTIEEDEDYVYEGDVESIQEYNTYEYKITLPFSMGVGAALTLNNLTLAGDLGYTDWTQMEYKRLEWVGLANRQIKRTYTDAIRFNLGAEYLIPQASTSLRAGFYHDPVPYRSELVKKNRYFFTAGVGFLIDQVMTLDLAWAHGSWELQDFITPGLIEKYTTDRIFVSVAYRL